MGPGDRKKQQKGGGKEKTRPIMIPEATAFTLGGDFETAGEGKGIKVY